MELFRTDSNPLDKTTARWKSIKQLADQDGIDIKSIAFESVNLPVTDVIDTLLPWFRETISDRFAYTKPLWVDLNRPEGRNHALTTVHADDLRGFL